MYEYAVVSFAAFGALNVALWRLGLSEALFGEAYAGLARAKQWAWNDRALSTLHALISATGALACFLDIYAAHDWSTAELVASSDVRYTAPAASAFMEITAGYFAYDAVQLWVGGHGRRSDYAHHVISLALFVVMVWYGWALFVPIALQIAEASSPFLHGAWFLLHMPAWANGRLHIATQLAFAATFVAARIVLGGYMYYVAWLVMLTRWPTVVPAFLPVFCIAGFTAFYVVQWFWLYGIYKKVAATFCEPRARQKQQQQQQRLESVAVASDVDPQDQ
eukprot:m51a1_g14145 hypothetical protein (278) ;mRNA; f:12338-13242